MSECPACGHVLNAAPPPQTEPPSTLVRGGCVMYLQADGTYVCHVAHDHEDKRWPPGGMETKDA